MLCTITWILTDKRVVFKDVEIDEFDSLTVEAFLMAPIDLDHVKEIKIRVKMKGKTNSLYGKLGKHNKGGKLNGKA